MNIRESSYLSGSWGDYTNSDWFSALCQKKVLRQPAAEDFHLDVLRKVRLPKLNHSLTTLAKTSKRFEAVC